MEDQLRDRLGDDRATLTRLAGGRLQGRYFGTARRKFIVADTLL